MKILGLHIRNALNTGDRWSMPLEYCRFSDDTTLADMREAPDIKPDAVVYGGGSIITSPDFHAWPCPVIAWGVGHNERTNVPWREAMAIEYRKAAAICDLFFPRDLVDGFEDCWTPCASCLHPAFDLMIGTEPVHEFVRYSAARRIAVDGPGPHMTNECGDMFEAIRFLASGAKVVTSSYHGAYWAGLLGREVELVPWGSKFDYVPKISLDECRARNRRAMHKVRELIDAI